MSHEPPVPAANRSPYPIVEPPHDHQATTPAEDKAKAPAPAEIGSGTIIRLGAAVALGVGATVAALLFARRSPAPAKPKSGTKKQRKRAKAA